MNFHKHTLYEIKIISLKKDKTFNSFIQKMFLIKPYILKYM